MNDPWAFGWTQLLTIVGFCITVFIAVGGFRTFERWRRERLEDYRIEVAFDALTAAHETKFVFQNIRGPLTEGHEWADMPRRENDTDERRQARGPYYAALKRINSNKDFFERIWKLQPRCMAIFGSSIEGTFMKLHQARRHIEVAAQMLAQDADRYNSFETTENRELYTQLRRDIWNHGAFEPEKERVGKLLDDFVAELVAIAEPAVRRKYKAANFNRTS